MEAEDGEKAIEIMKEGRFGFSIVLLDITMPKLDGFGVLRVMQEQNWLKELPVIIYPQRHPTNISDGRMRWAQAIISAGRLMQELLSAE